VILQLPDGTLLIGQLSREAAAVVRLKWPYSALITIKREP
jgi:hypothetical protein